MRRFRWRFLRCLYPYPGSVQCLENFLHELNRYGREQEIPSSPSVQPTIPSYREGYRLWPLPSLHILAPFQTQFLLGSI